jgi:hypothetical protein
VLPTPFTDKPAPMLFPMDSTFIQFFTIGGF